VVAVVEPAGEGDLGDVHGGIAQKLLRLPQAEVQEIFRRGLVRARFEDTEKLPSGKPADAIEIRDAQILLGILLDPEQGLGDPPGVGQILLVHAAIPARKEGDDLQQLRSGNGDVARLRLLDLCIHFRGQGLDLGQLLGVQSQVLVEKSLSPQRRFDLEKCLESRRIRKLAGMDTEEPRIVANVENLQRLRLFDAMLMGSLQHKDIPRAHLERFAIHDIGADSMKNNRDLMKIMPVDRISRVFRNPHHRDRAFFGVNPVPLQDQVAAPDRMSGQRKLRLLVVGLDDPNDLIVGIAPAGNVMLLRLVRRTGRGVHQCHSLAHLRKNGKPAGESGIELVNVEATDVLDEREIPISVVNGAVLHSPFAPQARRHGTDRQHLGTGRKVKN